LQASTAASHDILEFRRCSCNALKPKAILGAPKTPVPSENLIRPLSGRTTLVPMVQSPDLGERDDLSGISVVDRPWIGRILLER
jgi:hypothetical protein